LDVSGTFSPTRPAPIKLTYTRKLTGGMVSTPDILFRLNVYQ